MATFNILLTIVAFAYTALCSPAAPVKIPLESTPSQGINLIPVVPKEPLTEAVNVINRHIPWQDEARVLERFFRTDDDGSVEFKLVLSNGLAQYQKISNKIVNGKTIQVFHGYYSEPQPDNTFRIVYYIADENGFRRLRRRNDSRPVLPVYHSNQ